MLLICYKNIIIKRISLFTPASNGCIILDHKLQKLNCGKEETFTCRLKDLQYLQDYSYSRKSVTIKTTNEESECS